MFGSVGIPHGFCFLWNPELLWLHVLSDSLIAIAYFLIPLALVRFVRLRRDFPFKGALLCFAAFIVACGSTHVLDVVTLWYPIYWVSGTLKALTAAISVLTLIVIVRIGPVVASMPIKLADKRFQDLIENAPDAILQVDSNGTIIIANVTAEKMFGYNRDELLGSQVDLLLPMHLRAAHPKRRNDFVHAGIARPMGKGIEDLHARRKDGSEISVEIGLSPVENEAGTHVTAMIRDVTDRKHAERELRSAQAQLNSLLEGTTVSVVAVDSSWTIAYMNLNAMEKLHVGAEAIGKTLWETFPLQLPAEREILEKVMETRQPAWYESYYAPLDLTTTVQAHPWGDGSIAMFFSDISQQKRLQRELEWERSMREQRLEVLARFSAGIAHEMKNPLAIIHARASDLAEMAEEGDVSAPVVAKTCVSIVKTSERALRILRGLAALAREGSKDPMHKADVPTMVDQAMELVRTRFSTHGILLTANVPDNLPQVECREGQIGQILLNLLNNAFDAVEGSPNSERWVRVEATMEGERGDADERLLLDVIDGGPPLSAEVKEHLMEIFYTTKPLGGGLGIGLSVSRAIATDHGGSLELQDSRVNTCFRLSLPVREEQMDGVPA